MTNPRHSKGVIRRSDVRIVPQQALIECGDAATGKGPLAVVPLLDGERIAGFEIRCGCGASAIVECVYPTEA